MGTDKIVLSKGASVASRDLEDAGELPGEVVDVLRHDFYKVVWPTGETTIVHVDRLLPVTAPGDGAVVVVLNDGNLAYRTKDGAHVALTSDNWPGSQVKP